VHGRWTFFDMPRGAVIKSSTEAAKAEELLFNMTVRDTVLAVQEGYFALYSEIKFLNGLELDYRENVDQLSQAEAKYSAAPTLINLNAVQQSKATLYAQLEQLIDMHVKLIQEGANMARAMGLPIGTLIKPSDDFQMRPLGSWNMALMPTIEHALAHREEILTAQTLAKSQSYLATSYSYSYLPKLSLYGYFDYNSQNGIYGTSDAKKDNKSWFSGPSANIGLIFSWNFDGTVNDAKSRSAKYASKQSIAKAQASRDMVATQTATAFAEYTTAKMSLNTSRAALANAKKARDTSKMLYQQNLIDATAFTAAANAVSIASESYTKSIFTYNNSLAKLYRYTSIWPVGVSEMLDEAVKILKEG
jgi:outer membrane protein TolC